MNVTCLVGLLC